MPGSSATAPTQAGRTAAAVRPCCHRTEASTDCSSWSRDATRRSASTWCCPSCTASSARTARCRACWSSPASPTQAATSRAPPCAWTSPWPTSSPASAGIATPNFWTVTANEDVDPDQLTYPVFVKPARSGSSFGVSKVARAGRAAERGGDRTTVRLEGADRGGRRRQRGRLRHPGERSDLLAGEVDRIALSHGFFRIHQESEPESGSENSTLDRSRRHLGRVALARPGDGEGRLSRPGMQGTGAGGHVPQGGRNGRPQRGQHACPA